MKYIQKLLSNEIREKLKLIRDPISGKIRENLKDSCSLFSSSLIRTEIEKNAQIHSYKMEHPDFQVPYCIPKAKREIKKGAENIRNAFEWGRKNFNLNKLDEDFIKQLAWRITPELYQGKTAEYRETNVRLGSVTPPYPAKVKEIEMPHFIKSLKEQFKCEDMINNIESAIYAHLHLVRIHPFLDGNGRTSRVLQDIILDYDDIPLPIIKAGERNTYYQCLEKAIYDWKTKKYSGEVKHGATEGESLFYNFIAGKINVSLDKLIYCINH